MQTTVQWVPGRLHTDPLLGTAADFAQRFQAATGQAATSYSAAAATSGYILATAVRTALSGCSLAGVGSDVDALMWRPAGIQCRSRVRRSSLVPMSGFEVIRR